MNKNHDILPKFNIGQELFFTDIVSLNKTSFRFGVGIITKISVNPKDWSKDFTKTNMEFSYYLKTKADGWAIVEENQLFESLSDLEDYVFRYLNSLKN